MEKAALKQKHIMLGFGMILAYVIVNIILEEAFPPLWRREEGMPNLKWCMLSEVFPTFLHEK